MKTVARIVAVLVLLASAAFGSNATLSINFSNFASNPANSFARFTLQNCKDAANRNIGRVPSQSKVLGSDYFDYFPTAGVISSSIYSTPDITCGTVANNSWYTLTIYEGEPTGSTPRRLVYQADYQIGSGVTFDPSTATPITSYPTAIVSTAYTTVLDEAVALNQRTKLNFTGSGVAATDNAGQLRTDVTINFPSFSQVTGTIAGSQLPVPGAASLGGVFSKTCPATQAVTAISSVDGSITCTTGGTGVSSVFGRAGTVTAATNDYSFSQISGSVAAAQLPNPSASTIGGIESLAAASHKWINAISTSGVPSATQPASTDLSDGASLALYTNPAPTLGNGSGTYTETYSVGGSPNPTVQVSPNSWTYNGGGSAAPSVNLQTGNTATNVTNYPAPNIFFNSSVWNGSAGVGSQWGFQVSLGSGTNPSDDISFTHTSSATGPARIILQQGLILNEAGGVPPTPAFDFGVANVQKITLTANVTSSTAVNGVTGEPAFVIVCQDATGSRTFAWPTNFKGTMTVGSTASKCSAQAFVYDGTNYYATSPGVINQ